MQPKNVRFLYRPAFRLKAIPVIQPPGKVLRHSRHCRYGYFFTDTVGDKLLNHMGTNYRRLTSHRTCLEINCYVTQREVASL